MFSWSRWRASYGSIVEIDNGAVYVVVHGMACVKGERSDSERPRHASGADSNSSKVHAARSVRDIRRRNSQVSVRHRSRCGSSIELFLASQRNHCSVFDCSCSFVLCASCFFAAGHRKFANTSAKTYGNVVEFLSSHLTAPILVLSRQYPSKFHLPWLCHSSGLFRNSEPVTYDLKHNEMTLAKL